ncbi:D-beta-hydroxybutyrate dehydrogenase, mitochondrial-like [Oppia nitens]|uniref:D-beta-hydroxybutyrate dehydrogenase, mitochondrial-like n=1 Tax=Oppia nitens TaxID=1686743 RepID=UPI0023D9B767|nr:D-beta-hydroxybutyrate dehydrogenase, mitochondrial-like [Oppia nitens]
MDWITILLGIFVILVGIGSYIYQLSNVFLNCNQWLSPDDKCLVITGCDTGIGLRVAKHFYRKGCLVVATVLDLSSNGAKELSELLATDVGGGGGGSGADDEDNRQPRLLVIQMDVTKDSDVKQAFSKVRQYLNDNQLQGLYALINNAGVCLMGEFDWLSWTQIQSVIDINVLGTMRVTKQFLPLIIQTQGRVINVSSINGSIAYPGLSIYSASKFAIEGLSHSLRNELSKFDVKVIIVKPGDYASHTNIMAGHQRNVQEMMSDGMDTAKRQLYGQYFHEYHRQVLAKTGLTSCSKSIESSALFGDFDEAVLAADPRLYIISSSLLYRLFYTVLYFMPMTIEDKLFRTVVSKIVDFKTIISSPDSSMKTTPNQ